MPHDHTSTPDPTTPTQLPNDDHRVPTNAGAISIEHLRLPQDFSEAIAVKKELLTIPITKPRPTWWIRTHPDSEHRLQTMTIELKEERELYLVQPDLWPKLFETESTFTARLLVTSINRQGTLFIWPLRLPAADGRTNPWHQSALDAAELGTRSWIRVQANMPLGAYEVATTPAELSEPEWPERPFDELVQIAFRNRLIDREDHPVLAQLRGEL